ncbi:cytochrome c [Novosphingobium sp. MMS21-SN21R]|uniref:c-type cytochrome n=1 Tax=Novosphingobium sp. MMS21-SN21R TaxID=2969298 RepID=UPI0028864741|nr:cytochrome c [Novosphingobium sp. MMS21-SN21R]MDT0510254.1 cytochrome c [Novosphingobium sp. MMS21-SN21R]
MSAILLSAAVLAAAGASAAIGATRDKASRPDGASPSGAAVFERWCTACHGRGPRYPGTASLAAKYGKDMPAALQDRKDLTPEVVTYFVRNGVSVMPLFRKTEITDSELAALGSYLAQKKAK